MLKFLDLLSQNTICVTRECTLKCGHCALWNNPIFKKRKFEDLVDVVSLIQKDMFFKTFKKAKVFNIIGGDPLKYDKLPYLLVFLKKRQIKIRVWTSGVCNLDVLDQIQGLVDEFVFYVPTCDRDEYREITGFDGLAKLKDNIAYLQQNKGLSVAFSHFVTRTSVPNLADIYEFAYQHEVKLYLIYNGHAKFQRESVSYIKRFERVRKVLLFKMKKDERGICRGALSDFNFFQEFWRELMNKLDYLAWENGTA
jgi:pyruvate-formate lyase-activating enzyme